MLNKTQRIPPIQVTIYVKDVNIADFALRSSTKYLFLKKGSGQGNTMYST